MHLRFYFLGLLLFSGLFLLVEPQQITAQSLLLSPADGAVMDNGCMDKSNGITWDFDWSDVPGATAYHIRVGRNPARPLINNMSVPSSEFHYASAPTDDIINTNLTGWRWMVRARVRGVWGRWSTARSFRVEKLNTDCR